MEPDHTPHVSRIPLGFGGIPREYAGPDAAVCLLPVPHGATSGFRSGVGRGPEAIIQASRNMELYDSELDAETYTIGIETADEIESNVNSSYDDSLVIEAAVRELLDKGRFPVVLGGDHAVSAGAVRAAKRKFGDIGCVMFDAHPDLFDVYLQGKFSHANIARRILDMGVPTALVGIRSAAQSEAAYIRESGMPVVRARDFLSDHACLEKALAKLPQTVYLSIDIDVLDPSLMPAVNYPEPGGLGWYEMLDALEMVLKAKKVVTLDVVELTPVPGNSAPDFVVAKLIYRTLGMIFKDKLGAR
jgi:agmatinase